MRPNHASELFTSFIAQKTSATIDPSRPQPQLCQYCQCQRDPHVRHHLQIRHLQIPKATKFAFSQNKLQKQINQAENQLISCLIFGPANRFEAAVQKGIRIPTRSSMRNIRSLRAAVPGIGGHDRLAVGLYAAVSWLQRRNMAAASAQVASAWGLISEPSPVPRMIPAPQAHCTAAMALSDTWAASA